MSDERLRELYAGAVRGRSSQDARHPAPEALVALVRREGREDARLTTLDHVMGCAECRREFDLLRTVEQAGAESAAAGRTGVGRSWRIPAALAATLLLAVGLGRSLLSPATDTTRGDDESAIALVQPSDRAMTGGQVIFAWRPAPGATRYELEVLDAGGSVAASAATSDTTAAPAAMPGLPAGEYRWWVRATTSDARTLRSPLRSLVLTGR